MHEAGLHPQERLFSNLETQIFVIRFARKHNTRPQEEIELTTDPDRILELAREHGKTSSRPAVLKARQGEGRRAVVVALAEEIDDLQLEDQARVRAYARAAAPYLREARKLDLSLPEGHRRLCGLAERLLPRKVKTDADAE